MTGRILAAWLYGAGCLAQTTQGVISGRVVDSEDGTPISNARVAYVNGATNTTGASNTNSSGYYVLPLLPPGRYRVRVTADRYQAQELQDLDLPVAAFLEIDFRLRLLGDVWEEGQYRSVFLPGTRSVLTFYGPDVDTTRWSSFERNRGTRGGLESTVSQVIDPVQVRELPLAGRDVYTMLVTQPAVTADTSTARGLGLAINGQRPSASNFLLDGLENNNYLVTGPLTAIAPEAVQEYRISTNNFSAEYGRTSGFLANAVTRAGGIRWHGLGYFYLKNEALNANDFQRNFQGLTRSPAKESQPGFSIGGPLHAQSLFASGSFEYLRSRGQGEPAGVRLPTPEFVQFTDPNSIAGRLLRKYSPPRVSSDIFTGDTKISPPVSVNRFLALPRIDYLFRGGAHRLMGRVAVARLDRPDFIWTPYTDFISPLNQHTTSIACSLISTLSPSLTNEARIGWNTDLLHWDRTLPEIPTLASSDGTILPGNPAFYGYRNRSRNWELIDNLVWAHGRHIVKAGGGLLLRRIDGFLTAGRDPLYSFGDIFEFAFDHPSSVSVSLSRFDLPNLVLPQYDREYQHNQLFFFAQDSFRLTPRLVLNLGARYENFRAPRNVGAVKDGVVALGSGQSLTQSLASSRLVPGPSGDQQLYASDNNDWAARVGFSYNLRGDARTLLRGAYGNFYDRPFDNLWQNLRSNNFVLGTLRIAAPQTNFLAPVATVLSGFRNPQFATDFPDTTLYQPGIRSAYVHSYFLGVEHQLSDTLLLEVNTLGSWGRKLITTDLINRPFSSPISAGNPFGRYSPALPGVSYRANQGRSDYNALAVALRRSAGRAQFQIAYTWSHSIDNQSDPLACDFFDLSFTRITSGGGCTTRAAFARQFDSAGDRGDSDFDQRHNLVMYSIWELPGVFRGWRFSHLMALRSGFPYTVNTPIRFSSSGEPIVNNRAILLDPGGATIDQDAPGGKRLLRAEAFREPLAGSIGNSGRNAFHGPGQFGVDLSLSRSLHLPRLGEGGRLTLRADAFNVLNHANLNNPNSLVGSKDFGLALYGRKGISTGFPAVAPFNETARQVQVLLRVEF